MEDHLRADDEFQQLIDSILDDIETRFDALESGTINLNSAVNLPEVGWLG